MEITTLQQRIEERAKQRLLETLMQCVHKEEQIMQIVAGYKGVISLKQIWDGQKYQIRDEYTRSIFEKMLPQYIRNVTDEILNKIDEIDYLVNNQPVTDDLPY